MKRESSINLVGFRERDPIETLRFKGRVGHVQLSSPPPNLISFKNLGLSVPFIHRNGSMEDSLKQNSVIFVFSG